MRSFGWALIQYDGCPYKKRKLDTERDTRDGHVQERPREKAAICKPKREAPGDIKLADT